jgi:hypothetical protein
MLEETDRQVDNARTRVTHHRLAGEPTQASIFPSMTTWSFPVTGGRMRIVEDGKEVFSNLASGIAYFRPAGVGHDVFNDLDQELIFVEVELIS